MLKRVLKQRVPPKLLRLVTGGETTGTEKSGVLLLKGSRTLGATHIAAQRDVVRNNFVTQLADLGRRNNFPRDKINRTHSQQKTPKGRRQVNRGYQAGRVSQPEINPPADQNAGQVPIWTLHQTSPQGEPKPPQPPQRGRCKSTRGRVIS